MSDEFVITIEETEDRIKARDLSKFLYSLRIAYYVGVKVSPENWNEYKKLFSEAWHNRDEFFESDLGEDDIYIARISKESPLKIGGRAKAIALAAALFIANGNEIDATYDGKIFEVKIRHTQEISERVKNPPSPNDSNSDRNFGALKDIIGLIKSRRG
jgi:hypothetical protein